MADLSAFFPLVAPRLPGVAEVSVDAAALRAAIRFCSETLVLQRSLAAVPTVAGQAAYTLTQAGEVVDKLLAAKLSGVVLEPVTNEEMDDAILIATAGTPEYIRLTGPMQVTLYPAPATANLSLVVRAAMRPARAATQVDDNLFERYADAIAEGAVAQLAGQPEKGYSNPNVAQEAEMRFREAIALAKERAFLNNARTRRARNRATWL